MVGVRALAGEEVIRTLYILTQKAICQTFKQILSLHVLIPQWKWVEGLTQLQALRAT